MFYTILNSILALAILIIPISFLILILINFKKELFDSKFYLISLIFLNVIFLNKLIFRDQTLAAQDFNNIQITFNNFFQESFRNFHTAPIWLNNFGGGFDAFSNPISNYFSPYNLLLIFISDVYTATNYVILFTLIFISVTSFLFFREIKFSKEVSFFGAVIFTFNSFVIMRLSPGVGVEYLYSFKWLPLILIFTRRVFIENKKNYLFFLALVLGFTFEGNFNMAFGIWLFWFLFIVVNLKSKIFNYWLEFVKIITFAFGVYAIKLLPGIDLMLSSSGRISNTVSGWRTSRIKLYEYLEYFFPISHKFQIPNFTPGMLVVILFIISLILIIFKIIKKQKIEHFEFIVFCLISLVIGTFLNTDNPGSEIFYNFPIFNRITVSPTFTIFLLFPVIFFPVYLVSRINSKFFYLPLIISFLVFSEILLGPSLFKNRSYTFNFDKMNPREVLEIPHYKFFSNSTKNYYFYSDNSTFMYPNSIEMMNVSTLNKFKYFYSNSNFDLIDEKLEAQLKYADYIVSPFILKSPSVNLVDTVDLKNYPKGFNSNSVKDRWSEITDLKLKRGWDEKIYIFENLSSPKNLVTLESNRHPWNYVLKNTKLDSDIERTSVLLSYSKWWLLNDVKGDQVSYTPNEINLVSFNKSNQETYQILYANPFIYLGMFISIFCFGFFVRLYFLNKKMYI